MLTIRRAAIALSALAFSTQAHGQSLERADELVRGWCDTGRFSGVVAVTEAGRETYFHACGLTEYPDGPPINRDSRFRFFSTSKQFTAATVMRLEATGALGIEDTLGRWLPEAPEAWQSATIHGLLTHTAGIPEDTNTYADLYRTGERQAVADWLQHHAERDTPLVTPGVFAYTNMGYELLAEVVARAGGAPFREILSAQVLQPAGMTAIVEQGVVSAAGDKTALPVDDLAIGYNGQAGAPEPTFPYSFVQTGAGALVGRLADLQAYDAALTAGTLLSAEQQLRMIQAERSDSRRVHYGYGWIVRRGPNGELYTEHSGGSNGHETQFARFPETGVAIYILSNFGFSDTSPLLSDLIRARFPRQNVLSQ